LVRGRGMAAGPETWEPLAISVVVGARMKLRVGWERKGGWLAGGIGLGRRGTGAAKKVAELSRCGVPAEVSTGSEGKGEKKSVCRWTICRIGV